ncbi:MAG: MBL fold metallo-hydrolase [Terracidiphilus sp.]|jgi:glyoxylase-like metal-dependent hydrolase (beta-lactamase superfamily II)
MRLTDRCYAITGLGYAPSWCVNAGFIAGDEMTLVVDTGGNTLAAQTIYGYACAARPGNMLRVINTEKHFDHIGGNGYFREMGIDVYGHAGIARTPEEFQAEIAEFNDSIPGLARRAQ